MCDNLFTNDSHANVDTDSDEATEHTRLMANTTAMENRSFYSDDDSQPAVLVPSNANQTVSVGVFTDDLKSF